jgi:ribosome modulation factor
MSEVSRIWTDYNRGFDAGRAGNYDVAVSATSLEFSTGWLDGVRQQKRDRETEINRLKHSHYDNGWD